MTDTPHPLPADDAVGDSAVLGDGQHAAGDGTGAGDGGAAGDSEARRLAASAASGSPTLWSWLLAGISNVVYGLLLCLVSPIVLWRAVRHGRYRRGIAEKLLGRLAPVDDDRPVVWFHAVSVGEVLQLTQLIEGFRREHADRYAIVVTTSTDTGYDLAVERFAGSCAVRWFPLDFSWAVSTALRRMRPELVVLVELELWPNFLTACHHRKIRTAIVNARMSEKSFRGYSRIRPLIARLLGDVNSVAAQNEEYAERLRQLGATASATVVTGSVKFDQVRGDRSNPATAAFRALFQVSDGDIVFIAGSTQAPEEQLAIDAWQSLRPAFPTLRLLLVPRHKERFEDVAALVADNGLNCVRRTSLSPSEPNASQRPITAALRTDDVLLLDTIGELGACWGLADVAFVGGSFGSRGGQNMLEPAAYGAAVMVGPRTSNFREIVHQLHQAGGICRLRDSADLTRQLERLLTHPASRQDMGRRARGVIERQQGAVARTLECLSQALEADGAPQAGQDSPDHRARHSDRSAA